MAISMLYFDTLKFTEDRKPENLMLSYALQLSTQKY